MKTTNEASVMKLLGKTVDATLFSDLSHSYQTHLLQTLALQGYMVYTTIMQKFLSTKEVWR